MKNSFSAFILVLSFSFSLRVAGGNYLELRGGGRLEFSALKRIGEGRLTVVAPDGRKLTLSRSDLAPSEADRRLPPIHVFGKARRVPSGLPKDFDPKKFAEGLRPLISKLKRGELDSGKVDFKKFVCPPTKIEVLGERLIRERQPIMPYYYYAPPKKVLRKLS